MGAEHSFQDRTLVPAIILNYLYDATFTDAAAI